MDGWMDELSVNRQNKLQSKVYSEYCKDIEYKQILGEDFGECFLSVLLYVLLQRKKID